MSKRRQVRLDEAELTEIQKLARRNHMTTAEWVRRTLRAARRATTGLEPKKKLQVVRAAAKHQFPTADVTQMLAEIEGGYVPPSQT